MWSELPCSVRDSTAAACGQAWTLQMQRDRAGYLHPSIDLLHGCQLVGRDL